MISNADQVILMMDSSKTNKHAFAKIADVEQIDLLITDSKIDKKFKVQIEELGTNVTLV